MTIAIQSNHSFSPPDGHPLHLGLIQTLYHGLRGLRWPGLCLILQPFFCQMTPYCSPDFQTLFLLFECVKFFSNSKALYLLAPLVWPFHEGFHVIGSFQTSPPQKPSQVFMQGQPSHPWKALHRIAFFCCLHSTLQLSEIIFICVCS